MTENLLAARNKSGRDLQSERAAAIDDVPQSDEALPWLPFLIPNKLYDRMSFDRVVKYLQTTDTKIDADPATRDDSQLLAMMFIQAYCYAVNHDIRIPRKIAILIKEGFERFISAEGGVSLDQAFGLESGRRGKRSTARRWATETRRRRYVWEMQELKNYLGITVEQAVVMVAGRIRDSPQSLTAETLTTYYTTRGDWPRAPDEPYPYSPEVRAWILSHYPLHSHPIDFGSK